MGNDKLVDLFCGIAPMADSNSVSIFHPSDEGFASYHREDVNITYLAPPVIKGYQETTPGKPRLWRVPLKQPYNKLQFSYSFAAQAIAADDFKHAMQALALGTEMSYNV